MFPTLLYFAFKIETLLVKWDCQPNFGVFTKWDQDLHDEEEEEEESEQDDEESGYEKRKATVEEGERQLSRKEYEEMFRSSFNDKCKVYFVDARHFTKAKVRFVRIIISQPSLPETWKLDKLRY